MMKTAWFIAVFFVFIDMTQPALAVVIPDSGQQGCYNKGAIIACPAPGEPFYGQDAQYVGAAPAYRDNGDGTVTDLNTGLMWSKGLDGHKVTPKEGAEIARNMTLGGYKDWRVPNIKELYSLIDFRGYTGFSGRRDFSQVPYNAVPFINTDYFDFAYGDVKFGERYIDAQWLSSTHYVSTTMDRMDTVFGVNFADGRIKGYGYKRHGTNYVIKTFYARYVRGKSYGENEFVDNRDGTITDRSSGLVWTKRDSGKAMKWEQALGWCEGLNVAGHNDWRLPNAKELQYIVDYSRSPDTTNSPAIDPLFQTTAITNEAGQKDFPFFWSSTTHLDGPRPGSNAAYVAFGRAIGQMRGRVMDVHGAGAQRSDPKNGDARLGHGPQGDAQRGVNFVRCVRGGAVSHPSGKTATIRGKYPDKIRLVTVEDASGYRILGHEAQRLQGMASRRSQGPGGMRTQGGPGLGGFVSHLDQDGDGRVSRNEFDGPPEAFDNHDVNHDGYLTDDEAPRIPPQGGGRFPAR